MNFELLQVPGALLQNLHIVWTLVLLLVRFTAMFAFIPGVGMGMSGVTIRASAIAVLAFTSMSTGLYAAVPANMMELILSLSSEYLFGYALAMIPLMIVAGVQTAGQLASTTMGLQASQLIDPSTQLSLPDLSRIYADLTIILFMVLGGHHVLIHCAAGLGGTIVPGSFVVGKHTVDLLIDRSADILRVGVMLASPVIVALLITNFVMGLISRAVPSVNIFIVSFPLTIGIGLILSILILPELVSVMVDEIAGIENSVLVLLNDVSMK